MKTKTILTALFIICMMNAMAQNINAMLCSATRDNTTNRGHLFPPTPNAVIKDFYSFIINIDTAQIKTFEPKFVYITCEGCEGENIDNRYKLPLSKTTTDYRLSCENSILDKYGKTILLQAERAIYKYSTDARTTVQIKQNLVEIFKYVPHTTPAVLEIEINGKIEYLYCNRIDFYARP